VQKKSDSKSKGSKLSQEMVITNQLGLHARPAAMFVRLANTFKSEILVEKDGEEINGKSIMGLMLLAAGCGAKLRITAHGPDAAETLRALAELIARKFDEE
jgi:phosphocarrier protein HPr